MTRKPLPLVPLAVSFAVVLPWLAFAAWYFGTSIPHTFWAKLKTVPPLYYVRTIVVNAASQPWRLAGLPEWPALRVVTAAFWVLGAVTFWRRRSRLVSFFAFAAVFLAAYSLIGAPPEQAWHTSLVLLALDVLFLAGGAAALGLAVRLLAPKAAPRPILAGFAVLGLAVVAAHSLAFAKSYRTDQWFGWRDRA